MNSYNVNTKDDDFFQKFQVLSEITASSIWGEYAFSQELLKNKIGEKEKENAIKKSKSCGITYADNLLSTYDGWEIQDIVSDLGLIVEEKDNNIVGNRILFAQFTTPNKIEIMIEPIEKYGSIIRNVKNKEEFPSEIDVYNLLLAHELFHWLEERDKEKIYTRTHKIELWSFFKFSYKSELHVLGEIAAMYFSQHLNGTHYSPFILDFLLTYSYDKEQAHRMFNQVLH